ncbi:MAG: penicillin-binding transpeptidase domain-containing protein [Candidatus Paceibacterota bacterium]|jgi:penicillin-binding protein 2
MFFTNRKRSTRNFDLSPDEIFVDASNLPAYDEQQFEGRLERAISRRAFYGVAIFCFFIFTVFIGRTFWLTVMKGEYYAERGKNNSLNFTPIFAERGNIYDRKGKVLVWTDNATSTDDRIGPKRVYLDTPGLGHLLGYVSFPNATEFATGRFHPQEFLGRDGVERTYNEYLLGERGVRIVEVGADGKQVSDHVVEKPIPGQELKLSVDHKVQAKLYEFMNQLAIDRGFAGGGAVIMDVQTGEILALASYPDYNPNILAAGQDKKTISKYLTSNNNFMLDRSIGGLYAPGSTFKLFVAIGALAEKTVNPLKNFITNGKLIVPNPYDKTKETVFKDWQNNGTVDMRRAIAVSCDVYFYIIGGGFGSQSGLGILKIEKYAELFGLKEKTGIDLPGEEEGVIPSPEWKAKNFKGEAWTLGNTYHTSIGQYGTQVTPIQMARAYAAIANNGKLLKPTVVKIKPGQLITSTKISLDPNVWTTVHEGMRQTVTEGTAKSLNLPSVTVAAKTGSAEIGVTKMTVNSWIAGYWPYENPRYAFAVVMEKGERTNTVGSVTVIQQLLEWMTIYAPEYLSVPARP